MNSLIKNERVPGERVVTVADFLSGQECDRFIQLTEARGFQRAPITTARGLSMRPDVRNNTRVMIDDGDLACDLWDRVAALARTRVGRWSAIGLNERFRYYRYDENQFFNWHADGAFVRSDVERSLYTMMIYLNEGFDGGATEFDDGLSIEPRRGMLLLFDHGLLHRGAPVLRGRKYVLRTDVMYRRKEQPS
jgi:prolyl 4-hydroxylase